MGQDEKYMRRCIDIANDGLGFTAPNPLVGSVIVHGDKIIGEGCHKEFGKEHAEVNAVKNAIALGNEHLFPESIMYVSLEPCNHFGKTPPCTGRIIKSGIRDVRTGMRDPNPLVTGKGIDALKAAGVRVTEDILKEECEWMNRRFVTFHRKKRPYVILKFAQTADGIIGLKNGKLKVSNSWSDRLVHKWRSEEQSIMVGTNTAMNDDPQLTVRKWPGKNPVRIVIDRRLRLPSSLHVFEGSEKVIIFNEDKNEIYGHLEFISIPFVNLPEEICVALFNRSIQSVLIEGGARLIGGFVEKNLWDEARVITSSRVAGEGIAAPVINAEPDEFAGVGDDLVETYINC